MKLYYHPLSTYSQKVLIAGHEKGAEYARELVQLFDPDARAKYLEIYPMGKIPTLVLDDGHLIPESSIIIEYLDTHLDGGPRLILDGVETGRRTRFFDRMYDNYLNENVTAVLFQGRKPEAERDQEKIDKAKFQLGVMYGFMESHYGDKTWTMGDEFTLADCAAAGPLFYAQRAAPFDDKPNIKAYFERLNKRASVAHTFEEAAPHIEAFLGAG